jgi:pyruvate,water dikinase
MNLEKYVLFFDEISEEYFPFVGGKGYNLAKLSKSGFLVPDGFCITTIAYQKFIETSTEMENFFDLMDQVDPDDIERLRILGQRIREHLRALKMPDDVKTSILDGLNSSGIERTYAVRSSATAEDLPSASFAGQQESFLNVRGQSSLLRAVHDCWASLFTDRAISYGAKNGFGHRPYSLSLSIQQMVFPEVSGIMFTGGPVTGLKYISINPALGLGTMVSGIVPLRTYIKSGMKKTIQNKYPRKSRGLLIRFDGGT